MYRNSETRARVVRAVRRGQDRLDRRAIRLVSVRHRVDQQRAVALTFDDGPNPDHTPLVLDTLERLGIVATFFLVGRHVRAHPALVRRILAAGHAVGSHSESHPDPWTVSWPQLVSDYRRGREAVEAVTGERVRLFRPPKGYVDGRGAIAMLAAGVRPWLWTKDPGDWQPDVTPDAILLSLGELEGGDVVLLHDGSERPLAPSALDRSATVACLPGIADRARAAGLHFTTLTQTSGRCDGRPPASRV
jgi:peptidoglycan/xylan/chitin deacetylase (PgdA/CDA1 family)